MSHRGLRAAVLALSVAIWLGLAPVCVENSTCCQISSKTMDGVSRIDPDKVLSAFGRFAPYQMMAYACCSVAWVIYSMQMMIMAFITRTPPFECVQQSSNVSNIYFTSNCSTSTGGNQSFSAQNFSGGCCTGNGCTLMFDTSNGETLASEFHLVCDSRHFVQWGSSIFQIGSLVACLAASQLADRYGRRWPLLICCWTAVACAILAGISSSYPIFLLFRLISGMVTGGIVCISWVASCEHVSLEFRSLMPFLGSFVWTSGYCLVGLLSRVFHDWRPLTLATSIPLLFTISYYWLLPETLHWYVAHGRTREAHLWIEKASKFNRKTINIEECMTGLEQKPTTVERNFTHLLKSKVLTIHTILFCYIGISSSFVYWGMSLFSTKLSKDGFTGYMLSGLAELPAAFLGPLLLTRFGRRTIGIWSLGLSGVALLFAAFLPIGTPNVIRLSCSLVGKFSNIIIFHSVFLLFPEMLPTTIRNATYGFCVMVAKVGSVLAPYSIVLTEIHPRFPAALFGAMSVLAAVCCVFFPETKGKELPVDIPDARPGHIFKRFMPSTR